MDFAVALHDKGRLYLSFSFHYHHVSGKSLSPDILLRLHEIKQVRNIPIVTSMPAKVTMAVSTGFRVFKVNTLSPAGPAIIKLT